MILADTTIWIDHLRRADPALQYELDSRNVAMHPLIAAEVALGSLRDRVRTVAALEDLPQVNLASLSEVRLMVEVHALHGRGVGVVDAFLLASTLLTPGARLWTRDKRLRDVAEELGVSAGLT